MQLQARILCSLLLLAPVLTAQKLVSVPPDADVSVRFPYYSSPLMGPRLFQQVVDRDLVASSGSVVSLQGMRLGLIPFCYTSTCSVNLDIRLGYAASPPRGMSQVFADNRAGTPVTVFSGSVQVPKSSQRTTTAAVQFSKTFVYDPSRGHLLVEVFEKTPTLASSVGVEVSMAVTLSDTRRHGKGGVLTGFGSPFAFWEAGIRVAKETAGLELLLDAPALTSTFFLIGQPQADQSLAAVGAPGNHLYVSPLAMLPHTHRRPFCSKYHYDLRLPVPPDPRLEGISFRAQAVALDREANALGLVFSQAADIRVGAVHKAPARLVVGGATATDGVMVTGTFGAVSMQLQVRGVEEKR